MTIHLCHTCDRQIFYPSFHSGNPHAHKRLTSPYIITAVNSNHPGVARTILPMAEVAGLTFSIASLVGLFTTCAHFFDRIDSARRIGDSYSTVRLKFDTCSHSFKEWGKLAGISDADGRLRSIPSLLDSADKRSLIYDILTCIEQLFVDVERLEKRYGLSLPRGHSSTSIRAACTSLQQSREMIREKTPVIKRLLWAIRDEKKFNDLVSLLSGLTNKLYDLVPVDNQTAELSRTLKELKLAVDGEQFFLLLNMFLCE